MRRLFNALLGFGLVLALWQALVWITGLPPYLLPEPLAVARALIAHRGQLWGASLVTLTEILAGFALGAGLGAMLALGMAAWPALGRRIGPILLISQVIPIFALAPILTLWLGYGMAPKVVVAALICFFPVAQSFHDGLLRCPPGLMDLADVMGANSARRMLHLRVPMALPALGSGLRIAAIYAPMGAVIGEWVGGSEGLGAVMIHANGRMRIDLAFAALTLVTLLALAFHAGVRALTLRGFARFQ